MDAFRAATEIDIASVTPITEGRIHHTHHIIDTSGNEYCLKHTDDQSLIEQLKNEHRAVHALCDTPLKPYIPELVESHITNEYGYILYTYYDRDPLTWTDASVVETFTNDCASVLSTLHLQSFEDFDARPYADWLTGFEEETVTQLTGTEEESYVPIIRAGCNWLRETDTPTLAPAHGDFHLPNLMLRPDGSIRRVIDWERLESLDPAYELAKVEIRIFELYAPFTPFTREELLTRFREAYRVSSELATRVDAYKPMYAARTTEKMRERVFKPWFRVGTTEEYVPRHKTIVSKVTDDAPYAVDDRE